MVRFFLTVLCLLHDPKTLRMKMDRGNTCNLGMNGNPGPCTLIAFTNLTLLWNAEI